jgi:hypothetical protein
MSIGEFGYPSVDVVLTAIDTSKNWSRLGIAKSLKNCSEYIGKPFKTCSASATNTTGENAAKRVLLRYHGFN